MRRSARGAFYALELAAHRIGLYGRNEIIDEAPRSWAQPAMAVGTLGTRETLSDRTVTVMGYCHSLAAGPYLALAELYLEP